MSSVDRTATRLGREPTTGAGDTRAYLLVFENDSSSLFPLPRDGEVVIGRAPDVDLRLSHASVSRRHAALRVQEGCVRVVDLGSHNGVEVNGETVPQSRILSSGDVVAVGDVVLVVRTASRPAQGIQILLEFDWRRRLEEEVERALRFGRALAVLAFDGANTSALGAALRRIDVVGRGDDGLLLVLLPETERADAVELARTVIAAHPVDVAVRAGVAACPADACEVDAIVAAARTCTRSADDRSVADPADAGTRIELGDRSVLVADPAMSRQFALLRRLATATLPILITGETGVGKENAAFAVHYWSPRRDEPFLTVNCAAIGPESLIESELFGHERGSFTGATAPKAGLFETASGGTVFLDEVGELSLSVQAKLLRVLEAQRVSRLGEARERVVDVRIVAATNRHLEAEVAAGRFRQDLFFRLGGATVILPPLRDRPGEIPLLARELLAQACARAGRPAMEITPAAMRVLLTHTWPGNVRELRNTMEYVAAAAPDAHVEPSDLPETLGGAQRTTAPSLPAVPPATAELRPPATFVPIADELQQLERRRMAEALVAANGVKSRAAQLIDMPIRTFTLKVKQYKL